MERQRGPLSSEARAKAWRLHCAWQFADTAGRQVQRRRAVCWEARGQRIVTGSGAFLPGCEGSWRTEQRWSWSY